MTSLKCNHQLTFRSTYLYIVFFSRPYTYTPFCLYLPPTLPLCEITAEWYHLDCIESPHVGCVGVIHNLWWDLSFPNGLWAPCNGLKLKAWSELVYVTSILCDNDAVLSGLSVPLLCWFTTKAPVRQQDWPHWWWSASVYNCLSILPMQRLLP